MGMTAEERYGSIVELINHHMMSCMLFCASEMENLSKKKQKLYLAFELGVLEYYHRAFVMLEDSIDFNDSFFEFLMFYGNKRYEKEALGVLEFWRSLAVHGKMLNERKLGFDSENNQVNPDGSRRKGHAPVIYFMQAMKFRVK